MNLQARAGRVPTARLGQLDESGPAAEAPPATPCNNDVDQRPELEVWQLLGRADVILRGVLEAPDRAERRRWEERVRVWLQDVGRAWVQSQRRPW